MPLVSIITATYNSENEILETYESIKNQTISDFEWLVTDDCSSDKTVFLLEGISKQDHRVKIYVNKYNMGAAAARNNSIKNASGEFLAFIDSDDLWIINKLEKQIEFMDANNSSFSFTAYRLIDSNGNALNKVVDSKLRNSISYEDMLLKKATLGCSTVMLRKDDFDDIEMPNIRTGQDYALWLILLKSGVKADPINNILTEYRILPGSISRNKIKKACRQWEIYRKLERLSMVKSLYCFCFYAWRAIFRK